jgi:fluoride exporter
MIWLIGIGGSLGACCRYLIGIATKKYSSSNFPISTWGINIFGSFLLGVLANLYSMGQIEEMTWSFWGIGFCGAFTTFSTFSLEVVTLLEDKRYQTAFWYVGSSLIVGVFGAFLGYTF